MRWLSFTVSCKSATWCLVAPVARIRLDHIAILQRGGKSPEGTMESERLKLLKKIVLELGDQAMFML